MVIQNTYSNLSNIVHTDFELGRVIQTVTAADCGITDPVSRSRQQRGQQQPTLRSRQQRRQQQPALIKVQAADGATAANAI